MTKDKIITAINDLFGDRSVEASTTLEWMEAIAEAVEANIEALKADDVE